MLFDIDLNDINPILSDTISNYTMLTRPQLPPSKLLLSYFNSESLSPTNWEGLNLKHYRFK